jgi:DNA-binding transcriptional LysR family regulator
MDFDQLHTFLEIVRLKSFSKAAQTCYRTQPAISAQVRQLEQELRTALFERFGSRITLTTAGKIFSEYAEQMLDLRRRAQDTINELDRNPRGELVIAANEATCIYVLPEVKPLASVFRNLLRSDTPTRVPSVAQCGIPFVDR